jgi:hypothetical protein
MFSKRLINFKLVIFNKSLFQMCFLKTYQLLITYFQVRNTYIQTQDTPNPNSLKFLPDQKVMGAGKTREFPTRQAAMVSPLARLFFFSFFKRFYSCQFFKLTFIFLITESCFKLAVLKKCFLDLIS